MSNNSSIFDPEVIIPKVQNGKKWISRLASKRKKLVIGLFFVILSFLVINSKIFKKSSVGSNSTVKTISIKVDKSFDFPALDNAGRPLKNKMKFKITNAEKTNQVTVKDQVFTAKNNKTFLIVNLELKNDETKSYNILPGDLVRLTYNGNEENKFAPDLHNNLVSVAALSTKIDRIGFVIPETANEFKFYVGELEGKKEEVSIHFPS